jgi:pilus assembly protein CpaC
VLASAALLATGMPASAQQASQPGPAIVADGLSQTGSVNLTVNKSTVITTRSPYKRVSIGQPDIADINTLAPTTILLTAKKAGTTQLILWDESDRSQVIDIFVEFDLKALQDQLKVMFPDSKLDAVAMGDSVALRGRVPNLTVAEQVVAMATPYAPKVMNLLEISGGQQVMLQVRFAEVSRGAISSLGIRTDFTEPGSTFGFINGPGGSPIGALGARQPVTIDANVNVYGAGNIGNFAFEGFISALKSNNLLRVLAEPNLTATSGEEASFLAGGEIPVPVPQSSGAGTTITIEYKQFGVRLNFVPVVLGNGRLKLKVAPEVSELDFSNAVTLSGTQIPALNKRNVTTTVELADGQTFAIAGLLNSRVQANHSSTPYLGDLPIIGALFRSVRYERRESELLLLVTPRVVAPMNPDQVTTVPGEKWRHPADHELFFGRDLGGEKYEAAPQRHPTTRPIVSAPAQFQGAYGFVADNEDTTAASE